MKLLARLYKGWDLFLELLFPKSDLVREVEHMSASDFAANRRFYGQYPPEYVRWSQAILSYRNRHVRAAIWELKYRKNTKVAKMFAELLAEKLTMVHGNLTIVPIPLSEKRHHERGYNQIEIILEQLPKNVHWTIDFDILHRTQHTVPQTKLSRAERLKNLEHCFEVKNANNSKQEIRNRHFVIIDDVMTTGSTIQLAREVLLQAGANDVIAIALAH